MPFDENRRGGGEGGGGGSCMERMSARKQDEVLHKIADAIHDLCYMLSEGYRPDAPKDAVRVCPACALDLLITAALETMKSHGHVEAENAIGIFVHVFNDAYKEDGVRIVNAMVEYDDDEDAANDFGVRH